MSRTIIRTMTAASIAAVSLVGVSAVATASDVPAPAYDIPNVAPKTVGGEAQQTDGGQYARTPILAGGMSCDPGNPGGLEAIAGRYWSFYDAQDDSNNNGAFINVTGWKSGPDAMKAVSNNGTSCVLEDGWTEQPGGTSVFKLFTDGTSYDAVVRVGNVVVSSHVTSPKGGAQEAKRIAQSSALTTATNLIVQYPPAAG